MAGAFGLALYALGQRRDGVETPAPPPRPAGRVVWLHAVGPVRLATMLQFAHRLWEEDGFEVVLTTSEVAPPPPRDGLHVLPVPHEGHDTIEAFLAHWRPEICVLAGDELRPILLHECAARQIPVLALEAESPRLPKGREGWFPGLMRGAMADVTHVMAMNADAARAWRKAGLAPERIEVAGRLEDPSAALPVNEAERESLAQMMAARPIWFAADLPASEEAAVLAAHRHVIGASHRLLLIIAPADPARAEPLAEALEVDGWSVALRQAEQEPLPETEIYIVEGGSELGLWYRLAPVSFLGGSLADTGARRSPFEPAALGSVVLHGPRPGRHGLEFGRLGAARAARAVSSGRDLGDALSDLQAPDRAARLAQAAWSVVTEGAEATERALDLLRQLTDGIPIEKARG